MYIIRIYARTSAKRKSLIRVAISALHRTYYILFVPYTDALDYDIVLEREEEKQNFFIENISELFMYRK